jgi:hypothetical protein
MHFDGKDTTFSSILQMYCTKNMLFYEKLCARCWKIITFALELRAEG